MFSGVKLRYYRQRAGKTQEALALELGITSAYLSNIENNKRTPSHKILEALAYSLSISIDDLWEREGTLPPIPITAAERGIVIEKGEGANKVRIIFPPTQETYLFIRRQIAEMTNEADPLLRELMRAWESFSDENRARILELAKEISNMRA